MLSDSPTTGIRNRFLFPVGALLANKKSLKAAVVNSLSVTPISADFFFAFSKMGSSKTSVVLIHAYIQMHAHAVKKGARYLPQRSAKTRETRYRDQPTDLNHREQSERPKRGATKERKQESTICCLGWHGTQRLTNLFEPPRVTAEDDQRGLQSRAVIANAWNPAHRAVVDAERGIPLASSLAEMIHPSAKLRHHGAHASADHPYPSASLSGPRARW